MKISDIVSDFKDAKTCEGKLNTYIVMCKTDKKDITIKDLLDFIEPLPFTIREKLHIAISATTFIYENA
jgi:hypothetical protein